MRKILISFMLIIISTLTTFAQKELPKFGTIDKADVAMTACDYDKDAAAYRLIDFGDVHYVGGDNDFKIQFETRERLKILKDKGIQRANIKIHFYNRMNYEVISGIQAVTYNLDNAGNVVTTKLEKSSIYTKKIDDYISEISFSMPDVKVGSVIEYKYTDTKQSESSMPNWNFQDDIPVRLSMYRIRVPSLFRFVSRILAYQKVEQTSDDIPESAFINGRTYSYNSYEKTYILRQIPALKDEPYMSSDKDYLERVVFQLSAIDYGNGNVEEIMSTWPKLVKHLLEDEDYGQQLKKNLSHTRGLDDSLKSAKTDFEKMLITYDYVRRNMNWNGGESIYCMGGGIKSV